MKDEGRRRMGESSGTPAELSIVLSATADAEARDFIRQQLRAFNDTRSEHHRAIRSAEPTPLDILIRNEAGEIVSGLISSTYWGWLEVNILWVAEGLRRLGHGRTLLRMAEAEARTRGCAHVMLTTYSFQARGFYEKEGYRVVGEMAGYPPGAVYYWLRKDL
jgi:ribosomal protein S18 acetylase RimI-like enzyme